jgi:uncharacterized protein YggU (UPF0235/DUF167 family)
LHAPPTEGRANEELLELLAKELGLPKSRLFLLRGAKSRNKEIEVIGIDEAELKSWLADRVG